MSTGLGKQTLGEHKQNLVHTRTQEKRAVTPQQTQTEPDLPVSVQESLAEAWVGNGLPHSRGALSVTMYAWDLLKEVTIIFSFYLQSFPALGSFPQVDSSH